MKAIINTYRSKNPIHPLKHLNGVSKLALVSQLALELIDNFTIYITTRGMSPFFKKKKNAPLFHQIMVMPLCMQKYLLKHKRKRKRKR